ncbi:MAG: hypothetical protein AAGM22_20400 [Acidobacteriota bacterium]
MDFEAIIWLLVMLVWFVSGIARQVRSMGKGAPSVELPPPPPPGEAPSPVRPSGVPRPAARPSAPPPPPPRPSAPPPPPTARSIQEELFRQLGIEIVEEEPVASEHRPTASERRRTESEHRRTESEHRRSAGEHGPTSSEVTYTAAEHMRTVGEHLPTLSEHLPGDVTGEIDRLPPGAYSRVRPRRHTLGRSVRRDLRGDRRNLAKAWLMREILGPAPGLKAPSKLGPEEADPL